jgi:hypothetical protein
MQLAYFLAVISMTTVSAPAPQEMAPVTERAIIQLETQPADADDAATGSIPAVVYRVNGEPLTCEQIRHLDEVELIADDSYCG